MIYLVCRLLEPDESPDHPRSTGHDLVWPLYRYNVGVLLEQIELIRTVAQEYHNDYVLWTIGSGTPEVPGYARVNNTHPYRFDVAYREDAYDRLCKDARLITEVGTWLLGEQHEVLVDPPDDCHNLTGIWILSIHGEVTFRLPWAFPGRDIIWLKSPVITEELLEEASQLVEEDDA